jgi:hypothetical protein
MSKPDLLPTVSPQDILLLDYELESFTAITEEDTDKQTTASDLAVLNNHLAMCSAVLPHVRTIDSLCSLSSTVCKLIETRRRVKKLQLGASDTNKGRTFEILE